MPTGTTALWRVPRGHSSYEAGSHLDMGMVRTLGQGNLLRSSPRYTWDVINVTRDNQELGSLYLLRQCLELWENEMKHGPGIAH